MFGTDLNADAEEFFAHYGVKGMKWGVRKSDSGGIPRKTNREAKKDATEFARAKMFYGEGAGNRRKLIKATVNQKSKDPAYKKAFESHLESQNMAKRASEARTTRHRKDAVNKTKKTARGVKNTLVGNTRYASTTGILLATAGVYAHRKGYDRVLAKAAVTKFNDIRRSGAARKNAQFVSSWMKANGFNF